MIHHFQQAPGTNNKKQQEISSNTLQKLIKEIQQCINESISSISN